MADQPWEEAERRLNEAAAKDAANNERQLAVFRPLVFREDATDQDLAFYHAAIVHSTAVQMLELVRTDTAKQSAHYGMGAPANPEPRRDRIDQATFL